jgi:branched-chain amino acid transport system substrate-binding protein
MRFVTLLAALISLPTAAWAADGLKIGFITTLSGPSAALGTELLDGFNLGLKQNDGKLGGVLVEVIVGDDQGKPDEGRQLAEKMIDHDGVAIVSGPVHSNIMLAVAPVVLKHDVFLVSVSAGPSQLAGKQCSPYFFAASWQNDTAPEAMGEYLQNKGLQGIYLITSNYPAGRDMLTGFKRYYKGSIVDEVYTPFGQLDYAAEIAKIRAAKPTAVFAFYSGGMAVNFMKQYAEAGLMKEIPLYGPVFSLDQTVFPGVGEASLGAYVSTFWTETLKNPTNDAFVASFRAAYGRIPSEYAATAYDAVNLLNAALTEVKGNYADKAGLRKALETAKFQSVRGQFKLGRNHFPVQDFYLAQAEKNGSGQIVLEVRGRIMKDHQDAYVDQCEMK